MRTTLHVPETFPWPHESPQNLWVELFSSLVLFFVAQIVRRVRTGVQELGEACIALVQSGGAVQSSPKDPYARRELADNGKNVSEKVSTLS